METNVEYIDRLNRSIEQIENNELISFTMEDFMEYTPIVNKQNFLKGMSSFPKDDIPFSLCPPSTT